jgi:hypothetical protein
MGGAKPAAGIETADIAVTTLPDPTAVNTAKPRPRPDSLSNQTEQKPKPTPESKPATEKPKEVAAPVVKSAAEFACEKRGGQYVGVGDTGAKTCQFRTRDATKQCRRESDCEGACLARSRTCAPVKPLLGCNRVLQQNGVEVELCID